MRREQSPLARVKPTALTDRAATIMKQTVWKYQHIIEKQSRQTNFTSFRWRRILEGLNLLVHMRPELQPPPELNQEETLLHQVDWSCAPNEHFPSERLALGKGWLRACLWSWEKRKSSTQQSHLLWTMMSLITQVSCSLLHIVPTPCNPIGSNAQQ